MQAHRRVIERRLAVLVFACLSGQAANVSAEPQERTATPQGTTHVLVISGIGGESHYGEAFREWGGQIVEAAVATYGVPTANVTFLAERASGSPVTGVSRKEEIEKVFAALAARTTAADLVFVVLIGHGTYQGGESRIALPGPDLSAQDFAALLEPIRARVAFVNTASASGEFAKVLAGPQRAIITSTKSGMERNESVFGRYFAEAFAKDVADTDKDGRVSLLEAYGYARAEVRRYYEGENRLLTEHAQIEDTGEGTPVEDAGPDKPQGALAARIFLGPAGAAAVAVPADASPALRALYEKKQELEDRIAALRARRDRMDPAEYERQLEPLLLELARTDQEIRRAGTGGPP
jgi:hypothetical protein